MLTQEKIDANNEAKLSKVKPELAESCRQIIRLAAAENYILFVSQSYRSIGEQNELYAIGRRGIKREKKVTNAKGGQSKHNFGLAVDFAFVINGELCWEEDLYQNLGRWAEKCHLNWGGDWRSFLDLPHVEL